MPAMDSTAGGRGDNGDRDCSAAGDNGDRSATGDNGDRDCGAAGNDWYEETRRYTLRLTRRRAISPSTDETAVTRDVLDFLHEDGLAAAYTSSGLDPLAGDPYGRHNAYAFLKGNSPATVILLGHVDTVDTADYGALEPWALDPEALTAHTDTLAATLPDVADDLARQPGEWLFGRGVADMKSGLAAAIVVMRRLSRLAREGALPLSVVLLATPDEENESAGILHAVRFLDTLRAEHKLSYIGAINTDYVTAHYPGDPHRYVYRGTVGKLLPSFFVVGSPSHAGAPFNGLDANLLAAELVRDLSMNVDLCETAGTHTTPPPVTLHASDLKTHYDTQLPFAAHFYLNVLTLTTGPGELLQNLRERAEVVLARLLAHIGAQEERWARLAGIPVGARAPRTGAVWSYAELRADAVARIGADGIEAELAAEWERGPAYLDRRERSLRLVQRLWTISRRQGPAVVLYYSPPYYPHVAPATGALDEAVSAMVAAHPELNLALHDYFPLLSDLSYLRLDPGLDLAGLVANMPAWQEPDAPERPGGYMLPLAAMRALDVPVVNLGPYGKGAHQPGERVLASYAFGALPQLLYETIERLGQIVASSQ